MDSFLKNRVFINPVGDLVNMNQKTKLCADYDIYNIWNFPQGYGLKVKIGDYSRYFSQTQQLHISEELEWNMQAKLVCTP